MPTLIPAAIGACVVLAFASIASAHHAVTPHFDTSREVVVEDAVITRFRLVNPHGYVYFEATDPTGEVATWRCELLAATFLRRMGWSRDTLRPGQVVTIKGQPARREKNVCVLTEVIFEDGTGIDHDPTLSGLLENPESLGSFDQAENRPARLANGQPNLSGYWVTRSFGGRGSPPPRFEPTVANTKAAASYDSRFDNPVLKCHPVNIIQGWNHDANVNEIRQLDDRIVLRYGFTEFERTIWLDADHPDDIAPSTAGHSVGRWMDDVLVVDTVGFEPGLLNTHTGVMHSGEMHIVERFRFDAGSAELIRDYVIEDPPYLQSPVSGRDSQGISTEDATPFDCTELSGANNERSDSTP